MTLLTIRHLGVTLSRMLFSNLNLVIHPGERLGIVAANGRGKSTLLRCLAGDFEPTEGEITKARGLHIGLVEQSIPQRLLGMPLYQVVLDALPAGQADSESWRVDIVLGDFDIPEDLYTRLLGHLSGGWQRMAMLARAWVREPDLLLLDEPTNHLDLSRIQQLERWINGLPRDFPVVICSHDRAFLDATTTKTLFLRDTVSPFYALPYSRARQALADADAHDERQFEKDMKQAQQLRRQAAKLKNIGVNSGSDLLVVKTRQLKERAERLEDAARPGFQERSSGAIRLANSGTAAKILVTLDDVAVGRPDGSLLFCTGPKWIRQGDRIVLLGANGTGKTRLVSLIREAIAEGAGHSGSVRITPSLVPGYADQSLSDLPDSQTPLSLVSGRFDLAEPRMRSLLAGAGMSIEMQEKPIGHMSGGQKTRLAMLMLRLTNPNFYLLDEPTNHLDIEGQEALEAELQQQDTTCLLVSHDRSFIRNAGNRFWMIEKKKLVEVDDPEGFFATLGQ